MNDIPAMTDPLGAHWHQPARDRILTDPIHALMSRRDFEELPEYNSSLPSGVYPGKMWRRREPQKWLLCWYGDVIHGKCAIHFREVLCV